MDTKARRQARQVSHAQLLAIVRRRRRELGINDPHRTRGAVPIAEILKTLEHKWLARPELEAAS